MTNGLALAWQQFRSGRVLESQALCEPLALIPGADPNAVYLYALCLAALDCHELALQQFDRVVAMTPGVIALWIAIAGSRRALGQSEAALAALQRASQLNPRDPLELCQIASAMKRSGFLEEALNCFREAIALSPDIAMAHMDIGSILRDLGRTKEALLQYRHALALAPDLVPGHVNLGTLLLSEGEFAAANEHLEAAAKRGFADPQFQLHRCEALHGMHRTAEAIAVLRATGPDPERWSPEIVVRRATLLADLGEAEHAHAEIDQVLASARIDRDPVARCRLLVAKGLLLSRMRRYADALGAFDSAIACAEPTASALANRAGVRFRLELFDEALADLNAALALTLDPKSRAVALVTRGATLTRLNRHAEAHEDFDNAMRLDATLGILYLNRGVLQRKCGQYEDALRSFDRALQGNAPPADVWLNRGVTLAALRRFDDALSCLKTAMVHDPECTDAHAIEGHIRVGTGDYGGFEKYHWHLAKDRSSNLASAYPMEKMWRGGPLPEGARLFLREDGGFGDSIQFCRYVPILAARKIRVVLQTRPPLAALMRTLDGIDCLHESPMPPAYIDAHVPMHSLPFAMGTTVDTVPARIPYLRASNLASAKWKATLSGLPRSLRVGLVWAGGKSTPSDFNRSIPLKLFVPLLDIPATFVSLTNDVREGDHELMRRSSIPHYGQSFADFADAAALFVNLDLVISVDTASAHLAGALGVPLWVLIPHFPDWRWGYEGESTPWYPDARIFRQASYGDWRSVIERVGLALAQFRPMSNGIS